VKTKRGRLPVFKVSRFVASRGPILEFLFPPPVPVRLDSALLVISGAAVFFVLLTRFAFLAAKSKILRFGLLSAVTLSVFLFAAVLASISFETWRHAVIPTWPAVGCFGFAIASIAISFVKYRGQYDRSLRNTILLVVPLAIGLTFLGSQMGSARSAEQRMHCKSHLKSIGAIFCERAEKDGRYPPAIDQSPGGPPRSWRVALFPEISGGLTTGYDASQSWDAAANLPAAQTEVTVYSCPSVGYPRDDSHRWRAPFALVTGPGTIFPDGRSLRLNEITDGTAGTILAVEAVGLGIVWTEPRDFDASRDPIGVNLPGPAFGRSPGLLSSYHPRCAQALLADGSALAIGNEIDPRVLRALTTAAGHEAVDGTGPP
jgi:hypothetical protein